MFNRRIAVLVTVIAFGLGSFAKANTIQLSTPTITHISGLIWQYSYSVFLTSGNELLTGNPNGQQGLTILDISGYQAGSAKLTSSPSSSYADYFSVSESLLGTPLPAPGYLATTFLGGPDNPGELNVTLAFESNATAPGGVIDQSVVTTSGTVPPGGIGGSQTSLGTFTFLTTEFKSANVDFRLYSFDRGNSGPSAEFPPAILPSPSGNPPTPIPSVTIAGFSLISILAVTHLVKRHRTC